MLEVLVLSTCGICNTMQHFRNHFLILLASLCLVVGIGFENATFADWFSALNHPVSVVEADIYVNRFKTTMKLKCFAEDLELLQGVEALEDGFYDKGDLEYATQEHAKYLAEKIVIRNAAGVQLKGKVKEIIEIEIPDEGIKAGSLMSFTMGFVIEYEYAEPPEFVTIEQKMVADGALLPSELKILMKQAGSDAPMTKMMKPSEPETFRFDWDSPILTSEASEAEWESWFQEQRKKNLGITSYSSVYSFIYITDHEVRHEVLIPLATLATLIDIERVDESFLEIDEQQAAAEKIKTFFSIGNPVKIDSVEVQPIFDRVDFYGLDLRDFAVQAEKRKVSMANGRVGLIMSYSTKGSPTKVEVTWDKFNNVIKVVDAVVFAHDEIEKTRFSMFLVDNTYQWNEPDRKPLPPITQVSSTIDLEALNPKIKIPMVATGLGLGAGLLALVSLFTGASWKTTLPVIVICAIGAACTLSVAQREIANPFVEAPKFEIEEEDAKQVFAQLHKNMFRAFDYRDESDVYDALAKSVDGELLRVLYLDIKKTLEMKEQGGATSRVNEVNLLDGSKSELPIEQATELASDSVGFGYRCKWNLVGTIEHWGHIHERLNKYDAEFKVQLRDDAWKITSMQEMDCEPSVIKTDIRKF
ncbi:MAG: hypothetical protein AB8B55_15080 [Mariniblastus sp.]